ncbi:MAG TPA: glycosyltransferase [Bacillota bacterium]|nr:glycosyltransferase [Bacillota bacterium]
MDQPVASVILPCKNEGQNVINTIRSMLAARERLPYEIIVIDDGSTDDCCQPLRPQPPAGVKLVTTAGLGAAQARNLGAYHAQGEYLVFCDAHLFVGNYWLENLLNPLFKRRFHGICPGIAPVQNAAQAGWGQKIKPNFGVLWLPRPNEVREVPILPGGCLAVTREAFEHVGGFDQGFHIWGHEDVELSIHLWLYGHPLAVHPDVRVLHVFRPRHPYLVTIDDYYYNILRSAYSHFSPERIRRIEKIAQQSVNYAKLMDELMARGVMEQRARYFSERLYDDDWFFRKFGMEF